ncbi:hypothetical protein Tco_1511854 [Tanacetum coccineum]
MSSASSAVIYTSVYTDSEPRRVFWGADEEISDGGSPRVIVYGYDGLPKQPVAPPSPDYIPGLEDPQTPPVPHDEDELYIEDEHEFPAEEQPLPPVVSPTAESPRYVTESDPEEDPEEYEDDKTDDGPVKYPMNGGEDRDDDDGDSSRDDADDEDEDEGDEDDEDEEEEEHLAPADSAIVVLLLSLFPHLREHSLLYHHLLTVGMIFPSPSSHLAREVGGKDYGFVSTVDDKARRQGISEVGYGIRDTWVDPAVAVPEIAPMTVGEVNTRVTGLAELHEHDTQDLYALLEDAQDGRTRIPQRVAIDSQRAHSIGLSQTVHHELQTHRDHVYAHETQIQAHQTQLQLQGTLIQTQHQMVEILRVIRDMRREMGDMQAELLALRRHQRARQPGPDDRIPDHQDASGDADSRI